MRPELSLRLRAAGDPVIGEPLALVGGRRRRRRRSRGRRRLGGGLRPEELELLGPLVADGWLAPDHGDLLLGPPLLLLIVLG